jgi:hypothetical protein
MCDLINAVRLGESSVILGVNPSVANLIKIVV